MKKLITILSLLFLSIQLSAQYNFNVDYSLTIDTLRDLIEVNKGNMIIYGNAYYNTGISYVRMHDYHGANDYCFYTDFWLYDEANDEFTEINPDFDPSNPDDYDWSIFDAVVSSYYNNNLQAYVRFGTSYPSSEFTIEPMSPPLDSDGVHFSNFAELCKRTVMHFNEGWDNGYSFNVKYWEFWNEPGGLFWSGTPMQYYRAYSETAQLLKSEFPEIKIGAPGAVPVTTLGFDPSYGVDFLDYIHNNNLPLDFYSWHIYGLMNPFALDAIASNIRSWLDDRGFTNTESHITEINHSLDDFGFGYFDSNAKGTAYITSMLITAQKSSVDKMFWYPGRAWFDNNGNNYTWVGYGAKAFGLMKSKAPIQIFSSGDLVIAGNNGSDTTNVMLLSSKSSDDSKVYLLLSNYNSDYNSFDINIVNLPWNSDDLIKFTANTTKNPETQFAETVDTLAGAETMTVTLDLIPSPSTVFIRLEKIETPNSVSEENSYPVKFNLSQNYPNPFNPETVIEYSIPIVKTLSRTNVKLKVYDILGRETATLVNAEQAPGNYSVKFDAGKLNSGVYFYILRAGKFVSAKKMIVLK